MSAKGAPDGWLSKFSVNRKMSLKLEASKFKSQISETLWNFTNVTILLTNCCLLIFKQYWNIYIQSPGWGTWYINCDYVETNIFCKASHGLALPRTSSLKSLLGNGCFMSWFLIGWQNQSRTQSEGMWENCSLIPEMEKSNDKWICKNVTL